MKYFTCVAVFALSLMTVLHCQGAEKERQGSSNVDVIIVGAGVAGLTAAYDVNKYAPTLNILLLETKDRIGGRTWSVPLKVDSPNGTDRFDLGGQWVGTTQRHVFGKLNELGIATYKQHINGTKLLQRVDNGPVDKYEGDNEPGGIIGGFDALNLFRKLESLAKRASIYSPFNDGKAERWAQISVAQWLEEESWTQEGRDAIAAVAEFVYDTTADNISLLYFLMAVNSAGGSFDVIAGEKGKGAQAYKMENGAMSLSEKLLEKIDPKRITIKFSDAVTQITNNNGLVQVRTATQLYQGSKVVTAIPPNQLAQIDFDPPLPAAKRTLLSAFRSHSTSFKFVVSYAEPFWRKNGFAGQIQVQQNTDTGTGDTLPSMATYDATSAAGNAALIGFCEFGESPPSAARREELIIKTLAKFLGPKASDHLEFADQQWQSEPSIRGCVASIPPGILTSSFSVSTTFLALLRDKFATNVHFAGTETATEWVGYISGAVQSGECAAREVLTDLGFADSLPREACRLNSGSRLSFLSALCQVMFVTIPLMALTRFGLL